MLSFLLSVTLEYERSHIAVTPIRITNASKSSGIILSFAGHGSEKYKYLGLLIYVFKHLKLHLRQKKKKKYIDEGSQSVLAEKTAANIDLLISSQIKAEITMFFLKGKEKSRRKKITMPSKREQSMMIYLRNQPFFR